MECNICKIIFFQQSNFFLWNRRGVILYWLYIKIKCSSTPNLRKKNDTKKINARTEAKQNSAAILPGVVYASAACKSSSSSLMKVRRHFWRVGWRPRKMRSFLSDQTAEQSSIIILMKRGVCSPVWRYSKASKVEACARTCIFKRFQQLCAKGHRKKRCSEVSSIETEHTTRV